MHILICNSSPEKLRACASHYATLSPSCKDLLQNYGNIKTSFSLWYNAKYNSIAFMCQILTACVLSCHPPTMPHNVQTYYVLCLERCSGGLHVTFCTAADVVAGIAGSVQ